MSLPDPISLRVNFWGWGERERGLCLIGRDTINMDSKNNFRYSHFSGFDCKPCCPMGDVGCVLWPSTLISYSCSFFLGETYWHHVWWTPPLRHSGSRDSVQFLFCDVVSLFLFHASNAYGNIQCLQLITIFSFYFMRGLLTNWLIQLLDHSLP